MHTIVNRGLLPFNIIYALENRTFHLLFSLMFSADIHTEAAALLRQYVKNGELVKPLVVSL